MRDRFEYQELIRSRCEIRLLELLPIDQQLSNVLPGCRIFHTSLDKSPQFLALSYVWGDVSDERILLVDNYPFRITRNLYDAVLSLREKDSVMIWIDAICINQEDNEEKGWQVGLMSDIYQQATGVIAWLGASADNSDTVIDYLNVLGEKAEACFLHHSPMACMKIWLAMTTTPSYMDDPREIVLRGRLDERLLSVSKFTLKRLLDSISGWESPDQLLPAADLNRFFRRTWWGRVWVLQEITLPEHASFTCGTKRISRRRLQAAYNAWYALWSTLVSTQHRRPLTRYQQEVIFIVSHRASVMLSMANIYRATTFPLVALLRATCVGGVRLLYQDGYQHLESTDPRDKIFALLGIAKDHDELEALGVFPDYRKSTKEVYTTVMAALLQQGHTTVLSYCRTSGTLSDLPSWVPDWSGSLPETLQDVETDHLTLCPAFNASGSILQIVRKDDNLERISVITQVYDRVLEMGDVPRVPVTGTCLDPFDWLYELLRLAYGANDIYADGRERLQAIVRTSHAATGFGESATMKKVDMFHDALPIFKRGIHNITRQDMKLHLQSLFASKEVKHLLKSECGNPSKLHHEFMRMTSGRSPFVTQKGHLGLSSRYVRPGDIVAVIAGTQVPFILRRRDDGRCTIVSEAYVDGIMDGDATAKGEWGYIEFA